MNYDCFISYASPDLALAQEVHRRLVAEGFAVWFDKARLEPGFDWHSEIEAGCEDSRVLLPLLTPRWRLSEWTKFETYGAEAIIPLLCEGSLAEVSTPPLMRFQALELDRFRAPEADWPRLFSALRDALARPRPDKTERLAHLPYLPNDHFVGRTRELNEIHEQLFQSPTAVLTQGRVRVIAAMGGVGKSTVTRHYAEKFWRCHPQIFWVDARLGYEAGFARAFEVLSPEAAQPNLTEAEKARRALTELGSRIERLLILDNAEDETSVQAWIPKTGACRTLITSRFTGWSAAIKTIHLYVLEPEPSRTLLLARAGRAGLADGAEMAACDSLARELGYLPLALEQAAAYVAEQGEGFTFADYLRLFRETAEELLRYHTLGSTEYPDSLVTTWKATVQKLSPEARGILRLLSFLADTPLPLNLLVGEWETVLKCSAGFRRDEERVSSTSVELAARRAAADLKRYSMAQFDGRNLVFHNLVQTIERLQVPAADWQTTFRQAERLFWRQVSVSAQNYEHWAIWRTVLPHLAQLRRHAMANGLKVRTDLLTGTALFHLSQGRFAEALPDAELAYAQAAAEASTLGGAVEANNVSVILSSLGRREEAVPWADKAIERASQGHSPTTEMVLKFKAGKAILLKDSGRPAEAATILEEVLPHLEASTWFSRADCIQIKGHLAEANVAQGLDATGLFRKCLASAEAKFGAGHPVTIGARGRLAEALWLSGDLAGAEPLARQTVDEADLTLGREHPLTAKHSYTLGRLLDTKREWREAEPLLQRALAAFEQLWGTANPQAADCAVLLGSVLQKLGKHAEAEAVLRRVMATLEERAGQGDSRLFLTIRTLASVLVAEGDLAGAEALYTRAQELGTRLFGAGHKHTFECRLALQGIRSQRSQTQNSIASDNTAGS